MNIHFLLNGEKQSGTLRKSYIVTLRAGGATLQESTHQHHLSIGIELCPQRASATAAGSVTFVPLP